MCGIWACLGKALDGDTAKALLKQLKGRGPEGARLAHGDGFQLGFTRLAINGLNTDGMQPMRYDSRWSWVCNGEIYNWKDLATRHGIETRSGSDCEILGPLISKLGAETDCRTVFQSLDGVFATVLVDEAAGMAFVGRDPYGVRPLYLGYIVGTEADYEELGSRRATLFDDQGQPRPVKSIVFASELKALPLKDCLRVEAFPPGHYAAYDLKTLSRIGFEPYHTIPMLKHANLANEDEAGRALLTALESAVEKRMMTERPVAALLSGGLDSSLIAALVQRSLKKAGAEPLKTFSIGFEGSEDLRYARLVADHIGSDHTEIVMTPDEFFSAVPDVIRDIESYDITTVRASVGNWLVSREIAKRTECKVVFNGDGSDEVFGGYKYFYLAPSDEAFEAETARLLTDIHHFDVLRSDRSISSHGLEARTPFLDKQFVACARAIATSLRRPSKDILEKSILRKAFEAENLLPREVLWRKKEAFSDGVSGKEKSWYEICQETASFVVGMGWEEKAAKYTHLTPKTVEAYYYRRQYELEYGSVAEVASVPYHWMPRWSPGATDPSARTLAV